MNIEAYDYTLISTVLGMLVVFVSLTVLSLLMVGLKASFGERPAGERRAGGRRLGKSPEGPVPGGLRAGGRRRARRRGRESARDPSAASGGRTAEPRAEAPGDVDRKPPPWLAAAVVAYLAGEEGSGPTAEPWFPEFNHFDPWLGGGPAKRRPGGGTAE
jgi:hypothetical protein